MAKRRLLILDINGLLIDRVKGREPHGLAADLRERGCAVFLRPHARQFVAWALQSFDVAVWTSARKENIRGALDALLPDGGRDALLFLWDQRQCTQAGSLRPPESATKPVFLKLLDILYRNGCVRGRHDETSTILLDDSVYKTAGNPPHTSVHPSKWTASAAAQGDSLLAEGGDLRRLLAVLREAADVREALARAQADFPALVPNLAQREREIAEVAGLARYCANAQWDAGRGRFGASAAPARREERPGSAVLRRAIPPPAGQPVPFGAIPLARVQLLKASIEARPRITPAAAAVPVAAGAERADGGAVSNEARKAKARRARNAARREAAARGELLG